MKVRIVPIEKYRIETMDGQTLGVFERKSTWNSMTEYARSEDNHKVIVDAAMDAGDRLERIFRPDAPIEVPVVRASPSILSIICAANPDVLNQKTGSGSMPPPDRIKNR